MTSAIGRPATKRTKQRAFAPLETIRRLQKALMSLTGFTFIELLLTIIIIGILIGISVPTFSRTFDNLKLNNFSRDLQTFMNYLRDRSVVEVEIIYLNLDSQGNEFWAKVQGSQSRLKTLPLPEGLKVDTEKNQVLFYPDGHIDGATISITNQHNQKISLTTKGVFSGVKILRE